MSEQQPVYFYTTYSSLALSPQYWLMGVRQWLLELIEAELFGYGNNNHKLILLQLGTMPWTPFHWFAFHETLTIIPIITMYPCPEAVWKVRSTMASHLYKPLVFSVISRNVTRFWLDLDICTYKEGQRNIKLFLWIIGIN